MNTTKSIPEQINALINVRFLLIESMIQKGIDRFGGPNNATIKDPSFRLSIGLKANYLVHGIDPYRSR